MSYESKYYNLDTPGEKWSHDEFAFVVQALEAIPREKLLTLVEHFGIRFTGGNTSIDHEELVSVLITDAPKDELLALLHKLD